MNSYADTSLFVSLYGRDLNSPSAIRLVQAHRPPFLVTPFGLTEFTSAIFAATARQKPWTVSEARVMEENFVHDIEGGVWEWKDFPSETWARARELSRLHAPATGCRAMDVIHVASALVLGAKDFYTFDQDQAKLARAAGLRVLGI